MGLTRDHIVWAYRILLDREPESDDVILPKMRGYQNTRDLRNDIVTSEEYQEKNRDYAQMNARTLVIREIEPGLRLVIDLADHAIGLNILRGRFELNEIEFVRRTVRPGQHVVDAGAHVGLFAMHMAVAVGPSGSVHCFEPFEANAECLEQAVRENRFDGRVVVERAAVGATSGTAHLVFAPATLNSGGAFIGRPGEDVLPGHETRPVPPDRARHVSAAAADQFHQDRRGGRGTAGPPRCGARAPRGQADHPVGGASVAAGARLGCVPGGLHRADGGARLSLPSPGCRRARRRGDRRAHQRGGVGCVRRPVAGGRTGC